MCALQRVKKVFFGTLADGQESAKDKQTQAVGVQRYGRLAFVMEVKIPRKGIMILQIVDFCSCFLDFI